MEKTGKAEAAGKVVRLAITGMAGGAGRAAARVQADSISRVYPADASASHTDETLRTPFGHRTIAVAFIDIRLRSRAALLR